MCFPTNAHNGLGDSDASSLLTVCREQKLGCMLYKCRAETSTHTYTHRKWYVCLCDKQCVCTLGWRACREEHSYNRIARGGGNVPFLHSSRWTSLLFLDFGGRDSQANQSARGIPASGVVQDLVDKIRSLSGNRWRNCRERKTFKNGFLVCISIISLPYFHYFPSRFF